jgi:16S rRNA (guanine527-N7)-methyltransferase
MDAIEGLLELLARYGISPQSDAHGRFLAYLNLLEKWAAHVNLIGSADWGVIGPLFEEALWASAFYPKQAMRHLDVGSGAGFPALVLRLLRPEMSLEMVESRSKRAAFLETVVHELELGACAVSAHRLGAFLQALGRRGEWRCVSWKGLRLGERELRALLEASGPGTLFWVFHGDRLPVTDPGLLRRALRLRQTEVFPARPAWRLSIYEK